jgi:uncharacterized protein (DUF1778 family)
MRCREFIACLGVAAAALRARSRNQYRTSAISVRADKVIE